MNEVAAAVSIPEEVITKALEAGDTEILKKVSRWRICALYRGRTRWLWSLPEESQKALELLFDNCRISL